MTESNSRLYCLEETDDDRTLDQALASRASSKLIQGSIKKVIGGKIFRMTDRYYQLYSNGKLNYEEMKINFNWNILNESYELFKTLNSYNTDISLPQLTK